MGTTSPDALGYPDVGYTSGIRQAVKDLADTAQTALLARAGRTFRPADSTALTALASSYTLQANDFAYQVDTAVTYRYNGSAWKGWESGWTSYTPTTTNITLSTSTLSGRWRYVAGGIECEIDLSLAGSGAMGTAPTFTVPVTMSSTYLADSALGDGRGLAGGTNFFLTVLRNGSSTTTVAPYARNVAGTYESLSAITSAVPGTWGSTGVMELRFRYRAA